MAKKLGNDYMVWIESAVAGTYNVIRGQQGCTVNRSAGEVDLSTKDDSGYGTSSPGLKNLSIDFSMIPSLPDANGYTLLETKCNAATPAPFNIQIRKGGLTGAAADVVFAGSVYGNLDSTDFGQNAGVAVKCKLSAAAAPTTDALA
jgi:predicted secreted protein